MTDKSTLWKILRFDLSQNFPNPFNPTTRIKYSICSKQFVTLKVYDILGRKVATQINEEEQQEIMK